MAYLYITYYFNASNKKKLLDNTVETKAILNLVIFINIISVFSK